MYGVVEMRYSHNFHEYSQKEFGGLDRRAGAPDGAIADNLNMSADRYPVLTVRPRRGCAATLPQNDNGMLPSNGLLARDCLAYVAGDRLIVDGVQVATLTDSRKTMAGIQKKICIWPDKKIYDRESGALTDMEATWEGEAVFSDGTYAGEPALANTISVAGDVTAIFRAGDGVAVTVAESGMEELTYGAYVIQEAEYLDAEDRTELRFQEETWRRFVEESGSSGTQDGQVGFPGVGKAFNLRIQRRAPELEGVFEHHNRLWGWHGGTICCCALGDPTNWESFNGDATDSWELETGTPGDITGGISYGGRPVFFKERRVIRIYGDYPGQYSTSETESLGVEAGSGRSLAIAGDTLYYKSTEGIMAYTGGYPYSVSEVLGEERYRNAVAGSDGVRYYVSMEDEEGTAQILCFDTRHRTWNRESGMKIVDFGWHGRLYGLEERGTVWVMGEAEEYRTDEWGMVSMVEFADITGGTTRKKGLGRVVLRLEADEYTTLTISIRYDSQGDWIEVGTLKGALVKGQAEVIIPIRRCDHYRIKIEGNSDAEFGGGWTLHDMTQERYIGSNRK